MATFNRNVFVNCPFDDAYLELARPLLFTVLYLGLYPRIAVERSDSGEQRFHKIVELIHESRFGIHDLSRCQAKTAGEFFRLNMPLELGIDLGCRLFGRPKWTQKRCLILETRRFRFQKAISDLSGCDIRAHKNSPKEIIRAVRDWLVQEARAPRFSPSEIKARFEDFMAAHHDQLREQGFTPADIRRLPLDELKRAMALWIEASRARR